MFNKKMQYVIKSVPTDDKQALENLLNEMYNLFHPSEYFAQACYLQHATQNKQLKTQLKTQPIPLKQPKILLPKQLKI